MIRFRTTIPATPWALLLCLATLAWLAGCPGDPSYEDPPGDDDGGPTEEDICDDGVDNDGDGPTDCDDPDCDDFVPCTWPEAVDHNARFVFDSDVQWADDCETRFSGHLAVGTQIPPCPTCDRTFEGPYHYTINSCEDLLDLAGVDLPDYGAYGIVFVSEHQRDIWTRDTDGVWASLGLASWDPGVGHYALERVDTLQNVGTLTTTLTFADAP